MVPRVRGGCCGAGGGADRSGPVRGGQAGGCRSCGCVRPVRWRDGFGCAAVREGSGCAAVPGAEVGRVLRSRRGVDRSRAGAGPREGRPGGGSAVGGGRRVAAPAGRRVGRAGDVAGWLLRRPRGAGARAPSGAWTATTPWAAPVRRDGRPPGKGRAGAGAWVPGARRGAVCRCGRTAGGAPPGAARARRGDPVAGRAGRPPQAVPGAARRGSAGGTRPGRYWSILSSISFLTFSQAASGAVPRCSMSRMPLSVMNVFT